MVERENCALRPAITLRQQRHRQKNGRVSGCKSNSHSFIPIARECPIEGCANIVDFSDVTGQVINTCQRSALGRREQIPEEFRVPTSSLSGFTVFNQLFECIGAYRLEESPASSACRSNQRQKRLPPDLRCALRSGHYFRYRRTSRPPLRP